ncbi:MAG: AAA family ATPase [Gemmataceae bacterium]|nr:AAA family ATPase [Gemmataceae bacterium]
MNPMNLLAGGALLGVLAGCWDKVKAVSWKLISLFIQQVEIPSEAAHHALVAYLVKHYKRSRFYDRMYGATYEHQRDGRYGLVAYELFGSRSVVFWNGWRPFVFTNQQENKKPNTTPSNPWGYGEESSALKIYSTITFLRGTVNVEAIVRDACAERNQSTWTVSEDDEKAKNRFFIHYVPKIGDANHSEENANSGLAWYQQGHYRLLAHRAEDLGKARSRTGSAVETLIFPRRIKDLIKEIELWRNNKSWYLERGIPWKRGWLLYGPPGTGKTALARAFAEDLNLPIYVLNLAEISNHGLMHAWSSMQVNVPCIALMEDIDNVFHGRENVSRRHGMMSMFMPPKKDDDGDKAPMTPLTFDCLLNCLDGVERSDGVFTIITTNAIDKIDSALGQPRRLPDGTMEFISTRPGRIDKAIELTYMEVEDKKRMAQRILGTYPAEHEAMLEFVERYPDLQETPAQFQERCGQIALACFWKEKEEVKRLRERRARSVIPALADVDETWLCDWFPFMNGVINPQRRAEEERTTAGAEEKQSA